MSGNNRKRAANFTAREESILLGLAKQHKHVLECKLTDNRTHSEKSASWARIADEYNAISGAYRPQAVLRKKYENFKKRVRKKIADEKCGSRGISGGPPYNIQITSIESESEVKEILGARLESPQSKFVGDDSIDAEQGDCDEWANETSEYGYLEEDRQDTHSRVSQLANVESDIGKLKKQFLEEEHSLKLQFLREKHNCELRLMEEKGQHEREQHRAKMEILQLQRQNLRKQLNYDNFLS